MSEFSLFSSSSASFDTSTSIFSSIRIVSYNILADCYVRVPGQPWNAFEYVQDEYINWNNRQPKIIQNLLYSNADVICLQEVVFEFNDGLWGLPRWCEALQHVGYTGVMQKMTQKEWTKNAERNLKMVGRREPTGLVTFFRNEKFEELTDSQHGSGSGVTVFLKFRCEEATTQPVFAINNIHLVGDPSKFDAHEKQLNGAFKHFQHLQKTISMPQSNFNLFEFICGDFNGDIDLDNSVIDQMKSTWFLSKGFQRAPTGSSWSNSASISRLDHIMFRSTSSSLTVNDYSPKNEDHLNSFSIGLPNQDEPSDHLMIRVDFGIGQTIDKPELQEVSHTTQVIEIAEIIAVKEG
jgi:mRNA deadenylase 3'-5' endonuclease subunit Ccr4